MVGVAVADTSEEEGFLALSCSACGHPLGRLYHEAPVGAESVIHRSDAPRYSLLRGALESYALGSAMQQQEAG